MCGFGSKLSTISFKTEIYEIPADFWSLGVENSKVLLETILKKIRSYEKNSNINWIDVLRENVALGQENQFVEINEGTFFSYYTCLFYFI